MGGLAGIVRTCCFNSEKYTGQDRMMEVLIWII